jgi:hypothetical protein
MVHLRRNEQKRSVAVADSPCQMNAKSYASFMRRLTRLLILISAAIGAGCDGRKGPAPVVVDSQPTSAPTTTQPTTRPSVASLPAAPLYQLSEREIDAYLRQLQPAEPDLHQRIVHLARKNVGQPYELYLLGESPFETIDDQPIYCLTKSDCVVFAEHTLAMALGDDFADFLALLQRIRYKDGKIGVLTRNHYTEADWNRNNAWLLRDITDEVGGAHVVRFSQGVNRARFFRDRYQLETQIPVETIRESFIPFDKIDSVKPLLRDGDIVNFVSGRGDNYWVGHVGLVALGSDGAVNLIHSTPPKVREEPIDAYIARAAPDPLDETSRDRTGFRGFKFLRVHDDPMTNLRAIDGPQAPRVGVPDGSPMTWERYVDSLKLDD